MGMEEVANVLHLTSRTLRRQLKEEQTTFQAIQEVCDRPFSQHRFRMGMLDKSEE